MAREVEMQSGSEKGQPSCLSSEKTRKKVLQPAPKGEAANFPRVRLGEKGGG